MRRKLKEFVYGVITVFLIFFGCLYYLNFGVKGDSGFISSAHATIYQAPRYNSKVISTIDIGDPITVLSPGVTDSYSFVKVRIEEPGKRGKIGYIPSKDISVYKFPDVDYANKMELIFCDKNISLDEFVPEFKTSIKEHNIVGVYFDVSSVDTDNRSDLEHFCTSLGIPWGKVYKLSEDSIRSSQDRYELEGSLSPIERFEDYSFLPVAFDVGMSLDNRLLDDIHYSYVLLVSENATVNCSAPLWLNYNIESEEINSKESIYASTEEKGDSFSMATLSDEWTFQIQDAYETAREEAAN